ncbi:MAG: DUF2344 domain-containing protein [Deltaproteobacteria bacterium]|nr:DUF2344 domain-containing protein [Deltaproteobacteria bacterium]
MNTWQAAFAQTGIDADCYVTRQRALNEVLPWDHIHSGVEKSFLIQEWERAVDETPTPDCRHKCLNCGVCDRKRIDPVLHPEKALSVPPGHRPKKNSRASSGCRYRLTFTKLKKARYLSHLELAQVFTRAFRRAGLDLAHSKGYQSHAEGFLFLGSVSRHGES